MTTKTYLDYLRSDLWMKIREGRLAKDGYQCLNCHRGRDHDLDVHHWYLYRDGQLLLGKESLDDLATFCRDCSQHLSRARQLIFGTGPWFTTPWGSALRWMAVGWILGWGVLLLAWWVW